MCDPVQCRYLSLATHLLLAVGPAGEVRAVDPRAPRPLGHPPERLLGHPLAEVVFPPDHPRLARLLDQVREGPAGWAVLRFRRADGAAEPLLCAFQRVGGAAARTGEVLVTGLRVRTVEDRLMGEAAVTLAHAAFACHRPAHRLLEAVAALEAGCPGAVPACRADLDRLLETLSQVVAWPDLHDRPTDILAVVETALARLRSGSSDSPGPPPEVVAEAPAPRTPVPPAALAYVVLHLAANAYEAGGPQTRLRVTVAAEADRVVLEFRDDGPGLAPEDRERTLVACPAGRDGTQGAGVGLAVCRRLLEAFGGALRLTGRPRGGTVALVTLPAATGAA